MILRGVLTIEQAERAAALTRGCGARVVFTNGCFDLLHIGHARLLAKARALGDMLIVGLNSDKSVKRLKGPARPLVPQDERAEMLAALASVDVVTIFEEDDPRAIIRKLRPDVHVKGGDYREDQLIEADTVKRLGGRVVILPLTEGCSTTGLLARAIEAKGVAA